MFARVTSCLWPRLLLGGVILGLATSCGDPQQQSKQVLQARDFKFTVDDFMRAAREGQVSSLRHFLEAGMEVDVRDGEGATALFRAAQAGRPEAVAFLLQQNASTEVTGPGGDSPLIAAARSGSPATVKILLDAKADPAFRSEKNWTALTAAAYRGDNETVRLLAPVSSGSLDEALQIAALEGKTEVIDTLLAAGADVFSRSKDNKTALMYAAANGHAEAVRLLLLNGAPRLAMDSEEKVAADYAAEGGHQQVLDILADPSITGVARTKDPAALEEAEKLVAAATAGVTDTVDAPFEADHVDAAAEGAAVAEAAGSSVVAGGQEDAVAAAPLEAEPALAASAAATKAATKAAGTGTAKGASGSAEPPEEMVAVARVTARLDTPGAAAGETARSEPAETFERALSPEEVTEAAARVTRPRTTPSGVVLEEPAPVVKSAPRRLQGARLAGREFADGSTEAVRAHVRMKEFRESQLPIVLEDVPPQGSSARIRVLTETGVPPQVVPAGGEIRGTGLELVKAERRLVPSKTAEGRLLDVSRAVVRDRATGRNHLVVKNVAAHSAEATALIIAGENGETFEVREGDEFSVGDTNPVPYRVIDVRPTQVIVENMDTGETATLARAYGR